MGNAIKITICSNMLDRNKKEACFSESFTINDDRNGWITFEPQSRWKRMFSKTFVVCKMKTHWTFDAHVVRARKIIKENGRIIEIIKLKPNDTLHIHTSSPYPDLKIRFDSIPFDSNVVSSITTDIDDLVCYSSN